MAPASSTLCDFLMSLLLFLPLFSVNDGGSVTAFSLLSLSGIELYLKILYYVFVIFISILGVLTLALQNQQIKLWIRIKSNASLISGVGVSVIFIISRQPYAAIFAFSLLTIKAIVMLKHK